MNVKAIGLIIILFLAAITAPVYPQDTDIQAADNTQHEIDAHKTAEFTLKIYYRGTMGVSYVIDDSEREFVDLVQGSDSYDLGEGQRIKVTIQKGSSKFNIDYRKLTAVLFADGKQVAGGTTLDRADRIVLTYEVK